MARIIKLELDKKTSVPEGDWKSAPRERFESR
jgi:hypothetical protein